jgi:hypothetical protein
MHCMVIGDFTNGHNRNNPRYFTPSSLKAALDNWEDVIVQCEKYISIVVGGSTSVAKEFKAIAQPQPQTKLLQLNAQLPANEEPPPPYDVAVLPGHHALLGQEISIKDRAGMFKALAQSDDVNRLIAAFSPADVVIGVNRSQLTNIASSYQWIANNIRYRHPSQYLHSVNMMFKGTCTAIRPTKQKTLLLLSINF